MANNNNTTAVKLSTARSVQHFDKSGKPTTIGVQNVGDIVEMGFEEARRHVDRGLATYHKETTSSNK